MAMGLVDPKRLKRSFYLWIKSQPCVVCGREPDPVFLNEADHVYLRSLDGGMYRSHLGHYAYATLPLCRDCHRKKHMTSETEFYRQAGVDVYFELSNLLCKFLFELERGGVDDVL